MAANPRNRKKFLNKAWFILSLSTLSLICVISTSQADAQTNVAFSNPSPLPASGLQSGGSQTGSPFALGLEFSVLSKPITITALGAFDSTIGGTGTGFASTIYVGIYNETTSSFVGQTATFSGASGSIIDSYRFQSINALTLGVGSYVVIAAGYGGVTSAPYTPDWNAELASPKPSPSPVAFDSGGGALTFGNNLYANDQSGQLEATTSVGNDPSPNYGAVFGAGSFEYTVPEPTTTELAFVGAALLGAFRLGRRFIGIK